MIKDKKGRFTRSWFKEHVITQELLNNNKFSGKVLDVGCGLGGRTYWAAKANPQTEFYGVDSSAEKIAYAIEFFRRINTHYTIGDCLNLLYTNDAFDTVFTLAVIEHIEDTKQFIREIVRVLKPGGSLFLSVTENDYHWDPTHVHSFSVGSLEQELNLSFQINRLWVNDHIIFVKAGKI